MRTQIETEMVLQIMITDIQEYFQKSKEERQAHQNLSEPCVEIGGNSIIFSGILAYHLNTTIPFRLGKRICCCHSCGNSKCSNVKHLYFGSDKENLQDSKDHGTFSSVRDRSLAKYGIEGVKQLAIKAANARWKR
jgi:hypothetical protein